MSSDDQPTTDGGQQSRPVPPAVANAREVTAYMPVVTPDSAPAQPVRVGPLPPASGHSEHSPTKPGRRGRKLLVLATVLVVLAGLGVGGVFGGPWIAKQLGFTGEGGFGTPAPPLSNPQAALRGLSANAPIPSQQGIRTALDALATNPALGELTGSVLDAKTGQILWERSATTARTPASTGKVLTAAAALLSLDHQTRLRTTVVDGPEPGTVVVIGGGDPTLSGLPANKPTFFYPNAARLDDLVAQVKANAGGKVTKVFVDVGRYSGSTLAPGWLPGDVAGGHVAPVVPLMLDAGRRDPLAATTPRTDKPAIAAAQEFAKRLGATSVDIGTAKSTAKTLGTVESPPLPELIAAFLSTSDNVLAEAVAREIARASGSELSFAGAASSTLNTLARNGFDTTGAKLADGSGLSTEDRVSAKLLSSLLAAAAAGDERGAKLRPLLTGLPVAGGTGTLAKRYDSGGVAAGRGWVRAKTGTLSGVNSLAGVVTDSDGRLLVFAFMATGAQTDPARDALDTLAAALRRCGCH